MSMSTDRLSQPDFSGLLALAALSVNADKLEVFGAEEDLKQAKVLIETKVPENLVEAEKLLERIIKNESLSTEKVIINNTKLTLASLYLSKDDCNFIPSAICLYKEIIEDASTEKDQAIETKFKLALTLKKLDPASQQDALGIFGEILDTPFPEQDLAKLYYAEIFIKLNKESDKLKHSEYLAAITSIDSLIVKFTENLQNINESEKKTLAVAYFYRAKIFQLKNPSIEDKPLFEDFLVYIFKAYILGDSDIQKKIDGELSKFCSIVRKMNLITAYQNAAEDLKVIKPQVEWLSLFGSTQEFVEKFSNFLNKSKNPDWQTEKNLLLLNKMKNIIKSFIKNDMDFTPYFTSLEIHQNFGEFFYEEANSVKDDLKEVLFQFKLRAHITQKCKHFDPQVAKYVNMIRDSKK